MRVLSQKLVFKRLETLQHGALVIKHGSDQWTFGDSSGSLSANIEISDPRFYRGILQGGSLAAADMFGKGYWQTDDLTALLRLMLRNQQSSTHLEQGLARLAAYWRLACHQLRRNSKTGSRRNIAAHYDLSNAFFALFLDESMMYSAAIFPTADTDLSTAAQHKLAVICDKLALKAGDRVLEIGTGWGGFALYAAEHYGAEVVTTTLSKQQYDWAEQQIAARNLKHKITLLQQDYRQLTGSFDKLVSIEMIEAVGHQYYREFFNCCARLLHPHGQMVIQAITIQDQAYARAKREVDFIKQYIFPGSCIPSITALIQAMTQGSDMRLYHLEDIGRHYVTTLRCWRARFKQQVDQIRALGFDEVFIKLWEYYFCYCEAGFAEGYLGDVHLHCIKPATVL